MGSRYLTKADPRPDSRLQTTVRLRNTSVSDTIPSDPFGAQPGASSIHLNALVGFHLSQPPQETTPTGFTIRFLLSTIYVLFYVTGT